MAKTIVEHSAVWISRRMARDPDLFREQVRAASKLGVAVRWGDRNS